MSINRFHLMVEFSGVASPAWFKPFTGSEGVVVRRKLPEVWKIDLNGFLLAACNWSPGIGHLYCGLRSERARRYYRHFVRRLNVYCSVCLYFDPCLDCLHFSRETHLMSIRPATIVSFCVFHCQLTVLAKVVQVHECRLLLYANVSVVQCIHCKAP